MARVSVVDESGMIRAEAKDFCDSAPRVPRPRSAPKQITDFPLVVRSASSTETVQKPPRHNLDDDDSLCSEHDEESEFLTSHQSYQRRKPVLPTVSCGSIGWSHATTGEGGQAFELCGLTSLVLSLVLGFCLRLTPVSYERLRCRENREYHTEQLGEVTERFISDGREDRARIHLRVY